MNKLCSVAYLSAIISAFLTVIEEVSLRKEELL